VVDSRNPPICFRYKQSTLDNILWWRKNEAPTIGIQHPLDGSAYTRSFSQDHEFKAITGDECDVFAGHLTLAGGGHRGLL
jgi:hypothetical protein